MRRIAKTCLVSISPKYSLESWASALGQVSTAITVMLLAEEKGKVRFPILLEMAKTEHRRFNYFFASMGWGYNDKKIEKEKLHDCLCEWNRLVEKRQDALIYDLVSNNDIFMEKQQQQK